MGCSSSVASTEEASAAESAGDKQQKTPCDSAVSKYIFGERIGKGSFAQVHIAAKRLTREIVAMKIGFLDPELHRREMGLLAAGYELTVWKAVGTHANCVQLLDSFYDGHLSYMVMEKCDTSLYRYLQGRANVHEACFGKAFEQILTGISHMHSVSVIHRDLKPDNFLVLGSTVKICDFGLSAILTETGFTTGVVGTPPYMPPEMFATQTCNAKADIWSFGAAAYLFLCGDYPYQGRDGSPKSMKKAILNGTAPNCDRDWLSIKAKNFLRQLLRRKPSQRPSAQLALQSPFISNPDNTANLPCLRKVLRKAQKTGALDSIDVILPTATDEVLHRLNNGELENASIKSFSKAVLSNPQFQRPSSKHLERSGESSCGISSYTTKSISRSISTACGTSSYTSSKGFQDGTSSKAFQDYTSESEHQC